MCSHTYKLKNCNFISKLCNYFCAKSLYFFLFFHLSTARLQLVQPPWDETSAQMPSRIKCFSSILRHHQILVCFRPPRATLHPRSPGLCSSMTRCSVISCKANWPTSIDNSSSTPVGLLLQWMRFVGVSYLPGFAWMRGVRCAALLRSNSHFLINTDLFQIFQASHQPWDWKAQGK